MSASAIDPGRVDDRVDHPRALRRRRAAGSAPGSASWPDVVTTGAAALGIPVPATAARSSSAVSWVTSSAGRLTRYSAPPTNSMPMSRPLSLETRAATRAGSPPRWSTRAAVGRRSRSSARRSRDRCRVGRTCPSGHPSRREPVDAEGLGVETGQLVSLVEEREPRQPGHHRVGEPEEHHEVDQRGEARGRTRSPSPHRPRRCRARPPRAARPCRRPDRCSGPASSRPRPRPASTCRRASRRGSARSRR